ncbi:hypothetical protein HYW87_00565 [Candidatus Roizmanbacteria bacterium]|nr:hypothetical protein [Candidatus Roizmanbacteria bacterium]
MTLTELSYYTRKLLPFAILAALAFLILFYLVRLFLLLLQEQKPKPLYLNPVFGKIKKVEVEDATSSAGINFVLDTIDGRTSTATGSAKIFFLPASATRFGYREKIYLMATTLGFDTRVTKHTLAGKEASFIDETRDFTVDITNFNFNYSYQYQKDPTIFSETIIPKQKDIEERAINFLTTLNRYPEELAKGKTNVVYFSYNAGANTLRPVQTSKEANVVEVDFYRPDIDAVPSSFPVVTPQYFTSPHHVIMVFSENSYKVIKAQVKFFEKSDEQIGIYPVKTGDEVWQELTGGKGIIASNINNLQRVIIKKMFLAYLDSDIYQEYLQPVYVFLGDNDFVGYVSATSNQYLLN